jgi:glutathione synthase/RimK-type ligase-like ATP-grasp enzyme
MIGIHDSPGSFSDRWIEACVQKSTPFTRLNCNSTDILHQCEGMSAVFWHWTLNKPQEELVARQIIAALELKGILVFPNYASCCHYDDKVAQKYLLDAIGAPFAATWVFINRDEAMEWIACTTWPKVFKLRCGAGSSNVRLVRSRREAEEICRRAFGRGFHARPSYLNDARTRLRKTKGWPELWQKLKRAPQTLVTTLAVRRRMPRQQGYVYFQEFLPGNNFDTRVTIIGNRAFGFTRRNRPDDFRASGSGQLVYEVALIDKRSLEIAFHVAERLGVQSLAFDFLFDRTHAPQIVEISYCYAASAVQACRGYWDRGLCWHEGHVWPQDAILEDVLAALESQKEKAMF